LEVGVLEASITGEPEANSVKTKYGGNIIDDTTIRNASVYGDMVSGKVANSYGQ
jgi:hypothetical protein